MDKNKEVACLDVQIIINLKTEEPHVIVFPINNCDDYNPKIYDVKDEKIKLMYKPHYILEDSNKQFWKLVRVNFFSDLKPKGFDKTIGDIFPACLIKTEEGTVTLKDLESLQEQIESGLEIKALDQLQREKVSQRNQELADIARKGYKDLGL